MTHLHEILEREIAELQASGPSVPPRPTPAQAGSEGDEHNAGGGAEAGRASRGNVPRA